MADLKLSWLDIMGSVSLQERSNLISVSMPDDAPSNSIQGSTHWTPHIDSPLAHHAKPLVFKVSAKTLDAADSPFGESMF